MTPEREAEIRTHLEQTPEPGWHDFQKARELLAALDAERAGRASADRHAQDAEFALAVERARVREIAERVARDVIEVISPIGFPVHQRIATKAAAILDRHCGPVATLPPRWWYANESGGITWSSLRESLLAWRAGDRRRFGPGADCFEAEDGDMFDAEYFCPESAEEREARGPLHEACAALDALSCGRIGWDGSLRRISGMPGSSWQSYTTERHEAPTLATLILALASAVAEKAGAR